MVARIANSRPQEGYTVLSSRGGAFYLLVWPLLASSMLLPAGTSTFERSGKTTVKLRKELPKFLDIPTFQVAKHIGTPVPPGKSTIHAITCAKVR